MVGQRLLLQRQRVNEWSLDIGLMPRNRNAFHGINGAQDSGTGDNDSEGILWTDTKVRAVCGGGGGGGAGTA